MKRATKDELESITDVIDMNLGEFLEMVRGREIRCAVVHGALAFFNKALPSLQTSSPFEKWLLATTWPK